MGAWGPGIFSDDTALDVRDTYRELLEDGFDPQEATGLLLEMLADFYNDSDDAPVSWLTLAATQWRYGCLADDIKNRALSIIDTGAGLDQWEEAGRKALESRKKALAKLRDQLSSPQRPFKRPKKPWRYETDLEVGDAISYRLDSGESVILRVIGIESNRYQRAPIFELCDWIGDQIPPPEVIENLPFIIEEGSAFDRCHHLISPHKKGAYPTDKITVVAHGLRGRRIQQSRTVCIWLGADSWLNHIAHRLSKQRPLFGSKSYRMLKME